jgi:hypothetical protein
MSRQVRKASKPARKILPDTQGKPATHTLIAAEKRGRANGASAAAAVADDYNATSTHDYRLGDCILAKLNLRGGLPRRNQRRAEIPDHAWLRGFAAALGDIYRLLLNGNEPVGIRHICRAAGVTLVDLRAAGVSAFDLRALRQAGIPTTASAGESPAQTRRRAP